MRSRCKLCIFPSGRPLRRRLRVLLKVAVVNQNSVWPCNCTFSQNGQVAQRKLSLQQVLALSRPHVCRDLKVLSKSLICSFPFGHRISEKSFVLWPKQRPLRGLTYSTLKFMHEVDLRQVYFGHYDDLISLPEIHMHRVTETQLSVRLLTVACIDLCATKRLSMFRSGHFLTSALLLIHFYIQFWSYAAKAGKSFQQAIFYLYVIKYRAKGNH